MSDSSDSSHYVAVGPTICFACHAKLHPDSPEAAVYRLGLAAEQWLGRGFTDESRAAMRRAFAGAAEVRRLREAANV